MKPRIVKNIPPKAKSGLQETIRNLKVGESFLAVGVLQPDASSRCNTVSQRAGDGRKYQTAKEATGVRIWRIK